MLLPTASKAFRVITLDEFETENLPNSLGQPENGADFESSISQCPKEGLSKPRLSSPFPRRSLAV